MQCHQISARLDAWADGELSDAEARQIAYHLDRCPTCRRRAEALRRVTALLDGLPGIPAPAGFADRTLTRLRNRLEKPRVREWWQSLSMAMRGAVCTAALAGLLCGAVLGTSVLPADRGGSANPYQMFYASKGILP